MARFQQITRGGKRIERTRPAWRSYWGSWIVVSAGLLLVLVWTDTAAALVDGFALDSLAAWLLAAAGGDRPGDAAADLLGRGLLLAPSLLAWLSIAARRATSAYEIIDRQVIRSERGVISRTQRSITLSPQVHVDLSQTIIERLLAVGTLEFWTGDDRSKAVWANISRPATMQEYVEGLKGGASARSAAPSPAGGSAAQPGARQLGPFREVAVLPTDRYHGRDRAGRRKLRDVFKYGFQWLDDDRLLVPVDHVFEANIWRVGTKAIEQSFTRDKRNIQGKWACKVAIASGDRILKANRYALELHDRYGGRIFGHETGASEWTRIEGGSSSEFILSSIRPLPSRGFILVYQHDSTHALWKADRGGFVSLSNDIPENLRPYWPKAPDLVVPPSGDSVIWLRGAGDDQKLVSFSLNDKTLASSPAVKGQASPVLLEGDRRADAASIVSGTHITTVTPQSLKVLSSIEITGERPSAPLRALSCDADRALVECDVKDALFEINLVTGASRRLMTLEALGTVTNPRGDSFPYSSHDASLSSDSRLYLRAEQNFSLALYDLASANLVGRVQYSQGQGEARTNDDMSTFSFSPSGQAFAVLNQDNTISVFRR